MELLLLFSLCVALAAITVGWAVQQAAEKHRLRDAFCQRHGLTVASDDALVGRVDAFSMRFEEVSNGGDDQASTAQQLTIDGLASGCGLQREGTFAGLTQALLGPDLQTGDRHFDEAMNLTGDPFRVRATCDEAVRSALLHAHQQARVELKRTGVLTICLVGEADKLEALLRLGLSVARALPTPTEPLDVRLAGIARTDRNVAVRRGALEALATAERGELARDTVRDALTDPDSAIRLYAAELLRDGHSIVEIATNGGAEIARRIEAMGAWARLRNSLTPEVSADGLQRVLGESDPRLLCAAASLARHLDAKQEQRRLLELAVHADVAVQIAAIDALGALGDVDAVEKLLEVAEASRLLSRVKPAARSAVSAIQSRLASVERGGLSVVEPGESQGALSVAEARGGELQLIKGGS